MPKKKSLSGKVEDVRERRAVRQEIVEAVRILVIAMSQKKLPVGNDLNREIKSIKLQIAMLKLMPQEVLAVFRKGIEKSRVKVDGLDLIKVLQSVFSFNIVASPTIVVSKRATHRGPCVLTLI